MIVKIRAIIEEFERSVRLKEVNSKDVNETCGELVDHATNVLCDLRKIVLDKNFQCVADEIEFFKLQKPKVTSKLNYYLKIQEYLMEAPKGSITVRRQYIDDCQQRIHRKYTKYAGFEAYFRRGQTNLDEH